MTLTSETLMAYIDGELADEEARRVEAEIAARPELKAYVEQQRVLARALHDSFDEVLHAPLPGALLNTVKRPSSRWRTLRETLASLTPRRTILWSGVPAAAALMLGVLIGMRFETGDDIVSVGGALTARGSLAQALSHELASQPATQVAIGISFRDKSGRYCRSFQTASTAGVACNDAGSWRIAAVVHNVPEASAGAYQPAGSTMPDLVRNAVGNMIVGAPLDAAGERKARDAGWR
jgi:hypothetical protein